MSEYATCEVAPDGLATLRLHHGKVNALSIELLGEIRQAAEELQADQQCRCLVITGGPKIFAAGADISQFCENAEVESFQIGAAERIQRIGEAFRDALGAIERLRVPTIAAIHGVAFGGGCELALACDFRFASDRAKFGQPEILLGIIPGGGGTQRLARLIGPSAAKDLIFTGRAIDSAEALRLGLINEVVADDQLDARASEFAQRLARGPARAIELAKQAIDQGIAEMLAEGIELEQRLFVEAFADANATIGVKSFLASGPGNAVFD